MTNYSTLPPVKRLIEFWSDQPENIFAYEKEKICVNLSTLLSFCQEVLEIALILEIADSSEHPAWRFYSSRRHPAATSDQAILSGASR